MTMSMTLSHRLLEMSSQLDTCLVVRIFCDTWLHSNLSHGSRVSDIPRYHSKPEDTVVDPKGYRPRVPRDYVYSRSSGAPTRSVGGQPLLLTMCEASSVEYRISTVCFLVNYYLSGPATSDRV